MELQDIVRRLRMKQSIKAIKRETGKHRRVIRRTLELAKQEGWLDAKRELPSEHRLQEVYHEQRDGTDGRSYPLDAHRDRIKGWHRDGYSFLVIHELQQQRGVEYSETGCENRRLQRRPERGVLSLARPAVTPVSTASATGHGLYLQSPRRLSTHRASQSPTAAWKPVRAYRSLVAARGRGPDSTPSMRAKRIAHAGRGAHRRGACRSRGGDSRRLAPCARITGTRTASSAATAPTAPNSTVTPSVMMMSILHPRRPGIQELSTRRWLRR